MSRPSGRRNDSSRRSRKEGNRAKVTSPFHVQDEVVYALHDPGGLIVGPVWIGRHREGSSLEKVVRKLRHSPEKNREVAKWLKALRPDYPLYEVLDIVPAGQGANVVAMYIMNLGSKFNRARGPRMGGRDGNSGNSEDGFPGGEGEERDSSLHPSSGQPLGERG